MGVIIFIAWLCFVNAVYCKKELDSKIHFYGESYSCSSPGVLTSEYLGNLISFSKVVIDIKKRLNIRFYFGTSTTPFIGKVVVIYPEPDVTTDSRFFFENSLYDFPLEIDFQNPTYNTLSFYFTTGNSPTRIYGNVDGIVIKSKDDGFYNLPRQRTFFGTASNSTNYPHLSLNSGSAATFYGFYYGISSFGDKFSSVLSQDTNLKVVKVSCGGMFRYYSTFGLITFPLSITCNKAFTENDDDDFDSFIVTARISFSIDSPYDFFLSISNFIVESIVGTYNEHRIFTYPNMFYKYNSTINKHAKIKVLGTNERKNLIVITFYILAKTEPSSTTIMEVQNWNKSVSTYVISSSKQISSIEFRSFTETETIKSQLLLVGLENQEIETTNGFCESVIKKPTFEECYSCKGGSYLMNQGCSNEKAKCSTKLQSKCVSCNNGYYVSNGTCQDVATIDLNCLNSASHTYCSECKSGYHLNEGSCQPNDVNCYKYGNGVCVKCQFGYQLLNNKCEEGIDSHCYYKGDQCIECSDGYTLSGNSCVLKENKNGNNEIIYCEDGYYIENGLCIGCIDSYYCTSDKKFKCEDGFRIENHVCVSKTCESNEIRDSNGKCGIEIDKCQDNLIVNGRCVECENGSYPNLNGECISTEIEHCIDNNTKGCKRCSDGYYLDSNLQCQICSNECATCVSLNHCLTCTEGKYLSNHQCFENKEMNTMCKQIYPDGSGCAICKSGYYREGKGCETCLKSCQTCNRNTTCLECKDGYFMKNGGQCKSINETEGCAVGIDKQIGCIRCQDGYYKIENECYKCQTPCLSCSNEKECDTCVDEYVIDNHQCVSYHQISHCVDTKQSKCSECSFWYQPSSDGTYCETHSVWWMILLIVLLILLIVTLFVFALYYFTNYLNKVVTRIKIEKQLGIFAIKAKHFELFSVGQGLLVSSKTLNFGNGKNIPVNKPVEESLVVANKKKGLLEIKVTTKEKVDKYSIKSEPQVVVLKKNQAVKLKIIFNFICTCKVESSFLIVCTTRKNLKFMKEIRFNAVSEISTKLDYDELKVERKIGEGGFGIVYLGTFRGNKVAIKKMKKMNQNKMKEFKEEISMLDKFRSEYIVYFFGAVFILNKVCIVTEFAEFGSLNNFKQNNKEVSMKLRIKMIIDSAKGIQYLHSNGILHRDIKPDNILVTSLSSEDPVNAKLTDFGTSRNINMLMTNMSFTNGIGTPAYMAPEILNRQKYKMPSDVYSFAITMFECFGWCECYPPSIFEFSWNIADFITSGERRPKADNMTNEQYELIEHCWKQDPKERLKIDGVIENLQKFLTQM